MTMPEAIHSQPDQAAMMPYAPMVGVTADADIYFLSGQTASLTYHQHPHVKEEHILADDIRDQTRRAMDQIGDTLKAAGLTWRHVVKVTKYMTDIREADEMHEVMAEYFGDWKPASMLLCINNLSSPGARVELDMIAIRPRD